MVKQVPLTHAQRVELETQMEQARAVVAKYPTTASARRRLREVDAVRAVHRRALHEHRPRRHVRSVDAVGAVVRRHRPRLEDRRPQLPRVPPRRTAARFRRQQRSLAPAQRQRRSVPARCGLVVGGEDVSPQDCANRGGHKVLLIDIWMLHAWVVPGFECSWGVFSGECPELGGRLGGTAWEAPEATKS